MGEPTGRTALLEGRGLVKRFEDVIANDHVDFSVFPGEVLALLGENGAGKTTLMNLFYGIYQPDNGEILIRGQEMPINYPSEAIAQGIGMVHQHLMLIPQMTITENVVLGREITKGKWLLDLQAANREVKELSERNGLALDPTIYVGKLPVGLQQRVEILRLLYRQADILILDEPTSLLAPQEAEELFRILRGLSDQGKAVIFITHKLKEVFKVADRITVMRKGRVVARTTPDTLNERRLAELMIGTELKRPEERVHRKAGRLLLEVNGIVVKSEGSRPSLDNLTFQLSEGEVLGVAGIEGNGQQELVEALIGIRHLEEGSILFEGNLLGSGGPYIVRRKGIGIIPDDRQRLGLIMDFRVSENLVLNRYTLPPFARGLRLLWKNIKSFAVRVVSLFDIRTSSVLGKASNLSGGNQQKLVLARELSAPLRLLIACQPTRGVDIASVEFIHRKIAEAVDKGMAVLLISSDLDELMTYTDRIMVLFRGRNVGVLETPSCTKEILGQMMLGLLDLSTQ